MIKVLFLFPKSASSKDVDNIISSTFTHESKALKGMRSLNISSGEIMSPSGPPPYAKVVEATFDTLGDVMAVIQTPESQAGTNHMKALGVLILIFEIGEVLTLTSFPGLRSSSH